jgi:hypothetical protein
MGGIRFRDIKPTPHGPGIGRFQPIAAPDQQRERHFAVSERASPGQGGERPYLPAGAACGDGLCRQRGFKGGQAKADTRQNAAEQCAAFRIVAPRKVGRIPGW